MEVVNWGHKINIVAYVKGEPTEDTDDKVQASAELVGRFLEAEFVGVGIRDVTDEPKDMMAT
jgi:hypothetical protein